MNSAGPVAPGSASPAANVRGDGQPDVATVESLLAQVARGDEEAFAAVGDQVIDAVYGQACRIVRDQARSEQVTREVLAEIWRTASRFDPSAGSGLSWIMTIARRRAAGHLRSSGGAEAAEWSGESLLAHSGLMGLPGPQRHVVLLACCGYTSRQIADLLGLLPGTVAERLRDGLLRLGSNNGAPG